MQLDPIQQKSTNINGVSVRQANTKVMISKETRK